MNRYPIPILADAGQKPSLEIIVKEIIPIKRISLGFISRLILTLVIEIGIALLFGFTIKNSGKILLKTN